MRASGMKRILSAFSRAVQPEDGVELHELDAGLVIDLALVVHLHVALDGPVGMGVAVAVGEAQQLAVLAEEGEVAAPGVDADGLDRNLLLHGLAEGGEDFIVQGGKVPEKMSRDRDHRILETGEFAHLDLLSVIGGDDGASAGGAEVDCEVVSGGHDGYGIKSGIHKYSQFSLYLRI